MFPVYGDKAGPRDTRGLYRYVDGLSVRLRPDLLVGGILILAQWSRGNPLETHIAVQVALRSVPMQEAMSGGSPALEWLLP